LLFLFALYYNSHPRDKSGMDSPPPERSPLDFWGVLKSVAETGALFAFFSFATGWSYLASYFNSFGFRPMELDITPSTASLFALTLVYRSGVYLLFAAVAVTTTMLGVPGIRRRLHLPRDARLLLFLCLVLFILFAVGTLMGRATARQDVYADSSRLLSVGFYTDAAPREDFPKCVTAPTIDCKLLIRTKGNYYFFKPIHKETGGSSTPDIPFGLTIYALPESKVRFVQFQRGFE
jgi:hypothetical protein